MADHTNTVDYRSPVYLQMRELIRSRIAEGIYQPGGSIPSENELAAEFEINRLTVRSAVDILVKEGLLKRVQGKGVYVTGGKIEQDVGDLKGFTSTLQESRRKSGKKILARRVRPAGIKYASMFGIDPGDPVYYIRRLCSADGEPVSLEEIYIPQAAAPRLDGVDLSVFSLREAFQLLNVELKSGFQTLDITRIGTQEARILDTEDNRNVFLVRYTSTNSQDQVVEYGKCYIRGDKFSFRVDYDTP